jgi:hypothetical protein
MQDKNRHIEILKRWPPAPTPYQEKYSLQTARITSPKSSGHYSSPLTNSKPSPKGNQGLVWSEEEDNLLTQRFSEGTKITQLAKLHSRTYGAIKARLIKLELLKK